MKKIFTIPTKVAVFLETVALTLLFPAAAFAGPIDSGLNMNGFSSLWGTGLSDAQTLPGLIVGVTQLLLFFAFSVAVLFVIIGGFWYITSAGNEEQSEKGKTTLINAIIGIIIIIMSYAIIRVIINTVIAPGVVPLGS